MNFYFDRLVQKGHNDIVYGLEMYLLCTKKFFIDNVITVA